MEEQERSIATLEQLVDIIDMTDVVVYEHTARRTSHELPDGEEPAPNIEVMVRSTGSGLETRFKASYQATGFTLFADIGIVYEGDEPISLPESLLPEFISQVAFMGAFPYLRESLTTSASRLGVRAPVLGLVKRGQLTFTRDHADAPNSPDE